MKYVSLILLLTMVGHFTVTAQDAVPAHSAAEEKPRTVPTLTRLSFWVPPEQMAAFEAVYEEKH